jgi:RNA polymerase sigma-70 factor (ECF subfamily)
MSIGSATLTLPNEQALVARAKADPAAFAAIYDHYYPRIFNYAMVRLGDPEAANDVTAGVFEKVLNALHRYRPDRGEFGGWIFVIARNEVSSYQRAARRRRWLPLAWIDDLPGREPGPEAVTAMREEHARLLAAVRALAAHEQEILALKFGAELTNRQIARLVGRSESSVGVILYRGLRMLRKALADKEAQT